MKRTKLRLVLCCLYLAAVLGFIWGNSLMPGKESGELSGWVCSLVNTVLALLRIDTELGVHLLRKAAHFTEFAALGVGFGWLFGMIFRHRSRSKPQWYRFGRYYLPLLCGAGAACVDECIQIISPDRCCSIWDMALDTYGVIIGIALVTVGHLLVKLLKEKIQRNRRAA